MASTSKNKTPKKTDQVRVAYLGIRNLMFHNELIPGQKLSYRELAERLEMSQTPIIQALKLLEYQNLVYREPHRGYYMAPVSIREVEEIYDLRELIESTLLGHTMKHLDDKSVRRLETALENHLHASKGLGLHHRLVRDVDFHLTLAELSGFGVHLQTLRNLFDLLYLKYGVNILFSTSMEQADTDHEALFKSIVEGDAKTAKHLLVSHIRRVRKHVVGGLEKMQKSKVRLSSNR